MQLPVGVFQKCPGRPGGPGGVALGPRPGSSGSQRDQAQQPGWKARPTSIALRVMALALVAHILVIRTCSPGSRLRERLPSDAANCAPGRVAVEQRPGVFARRQHLHPHTHLPQVFRRLDEFPSPGTAFAEQPDGQADRGGCGAGSSSLQPAYSEGHQQRCQWRFGWWGFMADRGTGRFATATKVAHGPCTASRWRAVVQ